MKILLFYFIQQLVTHFNINIASFITVNNITCESIDQILLVGHSFGGSASIIAAAKGARVRGLILLDPAVVHNKVVRQMRRVKVPVILIGADKKSINL